MPLRIAFDLDGVLADMASELARMAEELFGDGARRHALAGSSGGSPEVQNPSSNAGQEADGPDGELARQDELPVVPLALSPAEQRRLWKRVQAIENFWETLDEHEPGVVQRLAAIAAERRWEVIFLTKRPSSAGATAQVQSQRWLQSKGFPYPSVYVVQGSRGRIAAALELDVVVDDRLENCLDVIADSKARAILVWRDEEHGMSASGRHLGLVVVETVAECLDMLSHAEPQGRRSRILDRVKRALHLRHHPRSQ